MRNTKSAASLMALGMLLAAGPATTRPDVLAERTVVIHLPGPVAVPPSDRDTENYYYLARAAGSGRSVAILTEATNRVTIPPPYNTFLDVSGTKESLASGEIMIQLRVDRMDPEVGPGPSVGEANKLADEMANVIRERVTRQWDELGSAWKDKLKRAQQSAATATDQLAKAREQVATGEKTLRQETGRIDLSATGMQAAQDALELERQKIELDLAGLKARRDGLQEAIKTQVAEVADARAGDAVLQVLSKAVEVSRARLDRVQQMYKAGAAPSSEVAEAELALLQAEARRAERANDAGSSPEAMAQWNRALTDASIEQREKEARLSAATDRLKVLIEVAARRKELDSARAAEAQAAKQLAEAESRMRQATDWLERYGNAQLNIETKPGRPGARRAAE